MYGQIYNIYKVNINCKMYDNIPKGWEDSKY